MDERINLQKTYIVGIVRGKRTISMLSLQKIAIGLDVSSDRVLNFGNLLNPMNSGISLIKFYI
ncbi:hypothetical protein [Bacillus cereus]|uniref:hypothetical protein n=1 Tax=Bacillus cereus TaxID=1396 RepID=UPI0030F42B80